MRCDEVTALLPALVDGEPVSLDVQRHVDTCLRCQAELARYRRLLRTLAYAGAIGTATVAAGATAAVLIARSRRRSALRLAG